MNRSEVFLRIFFLIGEIASIMRVLGERPGEGGNTITCVMRVVLNGPTQEK